MEDYFNMNDGIMRPFIYEDAAIILQNVNPERGDVWAVMKKELRQWAYDNITDMMFLLDQHKEEVWAAAFPNERRPLENAPGWSSERLEVLAWDIQKWLCDHNLWIDVCIYYDGKRMSTSGVVDGKKHFRYNGEPFIEEGVDPRDYFEYVANPHILSMSFEGALCHLLAYSIGDRLEREFQSIFNCHGLYYELGDHWNLSCYKR